MMGSELLFHLFGCYNVCCFLDKLMVFITVLPVFAVHINV